MPWARILIAVIIALPVGAVAGTIYAQRQGNPQLAALEAEREASKKAAEEAQKAADEAKSKLAALERENRQLQDRLASASKPDGDAQEAMEAVGEPQGAVLEQPAPEAAADAGGREERGFDRREGETEEEREARMAQWREERDQRMTEFRDRMREFMSNEMANAPDKVTQDRLAAMNEHSEYMADLLQQMRDAQTDEERDAIRQQLQETGGEARQLVQEHQDYLLRESLKQNGVTDSKSQDAMMQSIKQTMESPFFRGPMAGFGGGPPGGWSGRGRGGDRGGDGGGSR